MRVRFSPSRPIFMRIIITADLPDRDMNKLWVDKKAQELQKIVDSYLRSDFVPHGHGEQNTSLTVEAIVVEK